MNKQKNAIISGDDLILGEIFLKMMKMILMKQKTDGNVDKWKKRIW